MIDPTTLTDEELTACNRELVARRMAKAANRPYILQIGRDHRQYHEARIPESLAFNFEAIQQRHTRHGFDDRDLGLEWKDGGSDSFDQVETLCVMHADTGDVIWSWTEGDGWREGETL